MTSDQPPSGTPVKQAPPRTPFDRLYRGILRALYEGRFVPGQRLVEPDLMAQFDAGRSTVREVLVRLEATGIVALVRHRGAAVRRFSRDEVRDLLDLVGVLLGLAARRAAERGAAAGLNEASGAIAAVLAPADGGSVAFDRFVQAREAFYRRIVDASGNRDLTRLFPGAQVRIMRLQLGLFGRAAEGMDAAAYAAIASAIIQNDAAGAELACRRHVDAVRRAIEQLPDRAFAAGGR